MMPHQLNWQEICQMIPKRKADAQKGDFGRLLCITGSRNMPGACLLSTQAALRGGAGLVTVATAPENPMRLAAAALSQQAMLPRDLLAYLPQVLVKLEQER